ncbi:MAG: hypothetical protein ABS62_03300 [Microbacterium sp. SCN 70-200]|uniref:hypothetical protein n=1 Tax=unclassified Microbacterium TaxID=2609290 RepID=UPI0008691F43|nr:MULTISPECIES: hypothetical protein [unclassified Microbacterium]MBN9213893.1 hypothetical protein [Microbacterium sp.]ODT42435.1 MAG: hypothetical protein ABS62_03300 [Microbacterium sp. SCN 70-200]OJV85437.1 MAG: hypothetical protein BGO46_08965 [Microbacterium sp. 70-16]
MRWDRFFEDLEDQLDSEWEAERAALDTEAERLRLSRVSLRERLVALARDPRPVSVQLTDDTTLVGRLSRVGADWLAVTAEGADGAGGIVVVPLWGIVGIATTADAVLASVRDAQAGPAIEQRMGFGFIVRDLVRRRLAVGVQLHSGRTLSGTIDRAGVDHLDLALHDPGAPRRAENVTGYRLVPFTAVVAVRLSAGGDLV